MTRSIEQVALLSAMDGQNVVQAVKATAPGLDPGVEADSIILFESALFNMGQMECYPKLRQRGVVTIPEEVRDGLELEEGDQLKLTVEKLD